jgi:hypothetical protein
MCKTYNTIGSFSSLQQELARYGITGFDTLQDIVQFQRSYQDKRQGIIAQHQGFIAQEKKDLEAALAELESAINAQREAEAMLLTTRINQLKADLVESIRSSSSNLLRRLPAFIIEWNLKRKIRKYESSFEHRLAKAVNRLEQLRRGKSGRYQFICSFFDEAVHESCSAYIAEHEGKKRLLDGLSPFFYGALGEEKVASELAKLPDEYVLINDFTVTFRKALYYKRDNSYIKSVQIDHLLLGPSGIFIIETKNWSTNSLQRPDLRSPVEQVRRANFAIYRMLNSGRSHLHGLLNPHHWGQRKLPLRNLVVFVNNKPREEFEFVKLLSLEELLRYIRYFPPVFTSREREDLAQYLLTHSGRQVELL